NRAAGDLHRQILMRIQVSSFETACRMIEANVGIGVLPESAACRHAKTMAIRIMPLRDEWAIRNMLICVRDMQLLPAFTRKLIDMLVQDAGDAGAGQGLPQLPEYT